MALTPDTMLERMEAITGERIGRSTLNRWVRDGLVTEPERRSLGRGRGGYAEFPPDALAEAVAAWYLLRVRRLRVSDVRIGRAEAMQFKKGGAGHMGLVGMEWLGIVERVRRGIPIGAPVGVRLVRNKDGGLSLDLELLEDTKKNP